MATCVIECAAGLKSVGNNQAAASLRPRAMPTDIPKSSSHSSRVGVALENKPGPSYSSLLHQHRGRKRSANLSGVLSAPSSWTDTDSIIQSMASKLSNSTISGPTPKTSITSANDPSDVLLHQLTQVCEQAQKTVPSEASNNKLTINTVLEADKNSSTLKSTKLANHFISCFVVGGEIRLCSPQIYSVIMKEIHEDDIMRQLRQFSIIDHMASSEQLTSLKLNRAIPPEAGVCGLMTKTNAERLVGALIDPVNYRSLPEDKKDKFQPVLVEHDCFGGCEGRLYSSLYPGPCIECIHCKCLMTTEAFCRHSHQTTVVSDFEFQEQQPLCHWGFDAANWAKYIRLHQLAESDQESIDQFHSFLKNRFLQEHDTLEENLEVLAKKTMISAPFSAMAAQLLAQQQQQQHHQASTSSASGGGGVPSSAPSSLPNSSSFIPPPSSVQSTASSSSNAIHHQQSPAAPSALGTNPLLLLQQQSPQLVQQLQSIIQQQHQQQQQQQQQTQANPMAVLMAAIQQQQFQSAISALRGAANVNVAASVAQPQMNDESEIPRKRAHTISDPSATIRPPPKQEEFALSSISFGLLPADQQLLSTLSQFMDAETLRRVTDHMNLCIAQRVQPIADENANLRRENQRLKEENTLKNDVLARIAAVGMQQQQQRNHFPSPLAGPSGTSVGHHHHHQQHPQQIAEQDSDIEIDDH